MAVSCTDILLPKMLQPGDRVRFVSPASTPDRDDILERAKLLESWGLVVEFGDHAFRRLGYLAGSDDERLADLNDALRDSEVRAIFTTRGGKGSYRIADRLAFEAVRRDPKPLVGFSDITVLHLNLWKRCRLVGIHGGLVGDASNAVPSETSDSLRAALMSADPIVLQSDTEEMTSALTTQGQAQGRLLGGNLNMISTAAGWALPSLDGAILLLEAVDMGLGQVDRELTMLARSGAFQGVKGVAVGQFTGFKSHGTITVIDLLREHLAALDVPILGGLPLGHGTCPRAIPIGATAQLDATVGTLKVSAAVRNRDHD